MWLKYFNEAIEAPKKIKEEHFFTIVFNFYLINYYSPAIMQLSSLKIT